MAAGGGIEQKLGELIGKVDMLIMSFQRSEDTSTESRREMYRRTDDLSDRLNTIEANMASLHKDVAEMKPVVEAHKVSRYRTVGAISVLSIFGSVITVSLSQYVSHFFGLLLK